jgi:hypothetical protein
MLLKKEQNMNSIGWGFGPTPLTNTQQGFAAPAPIVDPQGSTHALTDHNTAAPCERRMRDATNPWGRYGALASALTQTDGSGDRLTAARMSVAGLAQTKGLALRLCSAM